MRRACIDIGSNTTRLLVADDAPRGLVAVCEERVFTRIGAALTADRRIPDDKRAEVASVVAAQHERARTLGAREVHGVATAAVRVASNRDRLLADLRDRAGLEVEILSARAEARLAFRGAVGTRAHGGAAGSRLGVLDVGGGSSEVVIGTSEATIEWWTSLPVGSGTLTADHLRHDPPTEAELDAVRDAVTAVAAGVAFDGPTPALTLAVGGSATSLARLTGPVLDADCLRRALALLAGIPAAELADRHAIAPERVRMLPAGLLVLSVLAERVGGRLEVGRGGIREGVLLQARSG